MFSKYNLLDGKKGSHYDIMEMPVAVMSKMEDAETQLEITQSWIDFAEGCDPARIKGVMPMIYCPWIGAN